MKVSNPDFFKPRKGQEALVYPLNEGKDTADKPVDRVVEDAATEQAASLAKAPTAKPNASPTPKKRRVRLSISKEVNDLFRDAVRIFSEGHHRTEAKQADSLFKAAVCDRFTVVVVGEFSRGKSTFVNRFLGRELLPVGDMPTTTMLTSVRYNENNLLVHVDEKGKKRKPVPLSPNAWEGLVAENLTGEDPKGTVFVGTDSQLLLENSLEIIDTPGAGDIKGERAKCVSEALVRSDGAVIVVSATSPLSESEQFFVEQRLIMQRTPRLMLILTKLDEIPTEQRADMVRYIYDKLTLKKWDIPVFIPYDVEIPGGAYAEITGMDKVEKEILSWVYSEERTSLTEIKLLTGLKQLIERVQSSLREQEILCVADETERQHLIEQKKQKLGDAALVWGNARLEMKKRAEHCLELLHEKADECVTQIKERLQYEANKCVDAKKWWNEDYPYRLKIELTSAASVLNNVAIHCISDDIRWFNRCLEQQFKRHVLFTPEAVTDKDDFLQNTEDRTLEIEDLTKQRNAIKIVTGALCVGASFAIYTVLPPLLGMAVCPFSMLASTGIGTSSAIISEKMFRGKIEKHRNLLVETIEAHVPETVYGSIGESEKKVQEIYDELIRSASEEEKSWMKEQEEAIEKSQQPKDSQTTETLKREIETITALADRINEHLNISDGG